MLIKPRSSEYNSYFGKYIADLPDVGILELLEDQLSSFSSFIEAIPVEKMDYAYAEGKWNIKQVLTHINDVEQIFAYRTLAVIRGEKQEILGFDENEYIENANIDHMDKDMLLSEFASLRKSNLLFFDNIQESDWTKQGIASGHTVSARALVYIIAGHMLHHKNIIEERYL